MDSTVYQVDSHGLPIVIPFVDYSVVDHISSRRLLCFINHFVAHTISFLNKFSRSCQDRLESVAIRIQKTEATLSVLEAKLSSIPGLENVTLETKSNTDQNHLVTEVQPHVPEIVAETDASSAATTPSTEHEAVDGVKAKLHPVYGKYFKMIAMGVPLQAVKHKFSMENPNVTVDLLHNPDKICTVDDESDEEWSD